MDNNIICAAVQTCSEYAAKSYSCVLTEYEAQLYESMSRYLKTYFNYVRQNILKERRKLRNANKSADSR